MNISFFCELEHDILRQKLLIKSVGYALQTPSHFKKSRILKGCEIYNIHNNENAIFFPIHRIKTKGPGLGTH